MYRTATVVIVLMLVISVLGNKEQNNSICVYQEKTFNIGDLVTGDPCDKCVCTQYGVMCELMYCPLALCHDKVKKDCCFECPNGPNCVLEGHLGTIIVPSSGCTYSKGQVCYCYHDNSLGDKMEAFCVPEMPMNVLPACNSTKVA